MSNTLKLLVIGAHPDDAEFHAGGLMLQWASAGGQVKILCLTDGSAGHPHLPAHAVADLRRHEAEAAAGLLQAELEIWPVPDGELTPSLTLRRQLIREIRQYQPTLIVTHRLADYHPDHRACAQLVQDASYLLQVPNIVSEVAPLPNIPAIVLCADRFTYPQPFRADWVINTSPQIPGIVELLHCHASQVYEWLPHVQQMTVPAHNRKRWLRSWYTKRPAWQAKHFADGLFEFAEAFEVSEYGGAFDSAALNLALNKNN